MSLKSLKISFFILSFSFACACSAQQNIGVWASSNLGKCYPSMDKFMSENFWSDYLEDENIKINPEKESFGTNRYVWAIDATPQINVTSTLLSIKKSGEACIILYVPSSSFISFMLEGKEGLPRNVISKDTPPPGIEATRIMYQLEEDGVYRPKQCQHVGGRSIDIKCEDAFRSQ